MKQEQQNGNMYTESEGAMGYQNLKSSWMGEHTGSRPTVPNKEGAQKNKSQALLNAKTRPED